MVGAMNATNGARGEAPIAASWHCENIGPRQRRKRVTAGIVLLLAGDALVVALVLLHLPLPFRLLAFLPFAAGSVTLFQVRERTCVVFAARKTKDMDQGEIPVTDARELQQIARQARRVWIYGIAAGLVLTLATLIMP
jgi:hypothetical protein